MGVRSWLRQALGGAPVKKDAFGPSADLPWDADYAWGARTASGMSVSSTTALQVTAVMGCVRVLAEDLGKLPINLYRPRTDGGRDLVVDHWLAQLLDSPNDWQTWFDFACMMQAARALRGNAYAVILRDWAGVPTALIPINPDRVSILEAPDGSLFYSISRSGLHEIAVLKDFDIIIPEEHVLHIRWMSMNGLSGMSPISVAREAVGLALAQEQHSARLSGNGARPSGVLQTKEQLNEDVIQRLKENWKQNFTGVANSGRVAVLEAGLEWKPLTMTSVDMEFIESRKYQVSEIARMFRVAPHKIAQLDRATNNNVEQMALEHLTDTMDPHFVAWEQAFAKKFNLRSERLKIEIDRKQLLRSDMVSRYNSHRVAIMSGFETPNEARLSEGMNPLPGGDQLLQQLTVAPLGSIEGDTKPAAGDSGKPPKAPAPTPAKPDPDAAGDAAAANNLELPQDDDATD